jgi:membrane-associated protease RseP (regulator of RpoE activity)
VVTLTPDARGGEVRYTLDGSEVNAASPRYTRPLDVTANTLLQARTFRDARPVGFVEAARFTRVEKLTRPSWLQVLTAGPAPGATGPKPATHAWLGATLQPIAGDGDLIDATGGQDFGLFVREAPKKSAALRAGLRTSDVISTANGQPLRRWSDLELALRQTPGAPVRLTVRRNQTTLTLDIPADTSPDQRRR